MARRCELTGKATQTGHLVSHSNRKTKTVFRPNLVNVTLQSDALGRSVRLRVSANALRSVPVAGRRPDVRANVRFPTGGHFPEWVYARWGSRVCTISPEYKKIFMDEWTGAADIIALQSLQQGLQAAVDAVRPDFRRRR